MSERFEDKRICPEKRDALASLSILLKKLEKNLVPVSSVRRMPVTAPKE